MPRRIEQNLGLGLLEQLTALFRIEFDKLAGESDKVTGLREIGLFLPPCTITMVEVEGFDLKDSAYSKTQTEARIKNVLHSSDWGIASNRQVKKLKTIHYELELLVLTRIAKRL